MSTPFGSLRRKDREITELAELHAIIAAGQVMHLSLADAGQPFVVPLFYAWDGEALYFHSARTGTKMEILKRNPKVCFCITLDHDIIEADAACDFEAKHRTVIGFGVAEAVEDEAAKRAALDRIVGRFTDRRFEYPEANLKVTTVMRIKVDSLTGKSHGFQPA